MSACGPVPVWAEEKMGRLKIYVRTANKTEIGAERLIFVSEQKNRELIGEKEQAQR